MRSVSSLLDIFKICVYFQVAIFITLIRGYVISSSSFRFTLFVSLLILTFLSPAHHAEKDKSLIEFFFTILTSASSFVISESPLIVILILTDPSVISTIQPRLQRFIANRHSFSSPSHNIDRPHLPLDLVQEIVNQITTFKNYIAAKGVSRDWRSAFSSISRRPQLPLPGLMLSEPLLTDMRTLFSLYDTVVIDYNYLKSAENDPSDESTFLVIAIFGPMNSLAFTRVRLGAALNRRGEERTHETTSFFVYKFNFNASAWEEVTRLEGQAFFVGDGNSFSWRFPTSTIPSRGDCIYFTDDHWDWRKFPRVAYGGHDVGLFDMEIRDILPLTFGKDKPRFYSRPIFVTRNDKL
ncbi:hypothetical protein CMV_024207 [Castanea mollissima]|uniref:KIB1-4 beta-propeller domain-containing protein n=1 Tax=Castanea mollissima TaxID=60419 RepID=A0A8J4QP50_9ROSI|nr:hypothetical protein CMV_024207 [Castanea mollissima]